MQEVNQTFNQVTFNDGKCIQINLSAQFLTKTTDWQVLAKCKMILSYYDPSTARLIPECVDIDSTSRYVFLNQIRSSRFYEPSIQEIEECYYDDTGIPESVENYYENILVVKPSRQDFDYTVDYLYDQIHRFLEDTGCEIRKWETNF